MDELGQSTAEQFIESINECLVKQTVPHFVIAYRLAEAVTCNFCEELGYPNIYELASCEFGFCRKTTQNYLRIRQEFDIDSSGNIAERWSTFTYSQLVEMLPISVYDRLLIPLTASSRDIRRWKKDHSCIEFNGRKRMYKELSATEKEAYDNSKQPKKINVDTEKAPSCKENKDCTYKLLKDLLYSWLSKSVDNKLNFPTSLARFLVDNGVTI